MPLRCVYCGKPLYRDVAGGAAEALNSTLGGRHWMPPFSAGRLAARRPTASAWEGSRTERAEVRAKIAESLESGAA